MRGNRVPPSWGLGLASLPASIVSMIPGVTQRLTLTQRQADIRYSLGVEWVAKDGSVARLPACTFHSNASVHSGVWSVRHFAL